MGPLPRAKSNTTGFLPSRMLNNPSVTEHVPLHGKLLCRMTCSPQKTYLLQLLLLQLLHNSNNNNNNTREVLVNNQGKFLCSEIKFNSH